MPTPDLVFQGTDSKIEGDLAQALEKRFVLRQGDQELSQRTYLDTFDQRLAAAGLYLWRQPSRQGIELVLEAATGEELYRQSTERDPAFWEDFPQGGLRRRLAPLLPPRRLLRVGHLRLRSTTWSLLDSRQKTVARLHLRRGTSRSGDTLETATGKGQKPPTEIPSSIALEGIKGYDRAHRRARKTLEGLGLKPTKDGLHQAALGAGGRKSQSYTSKLSFDLSPASPAAVALKVILRRLLTTLEANEIGTRSDLDAEFLHDFRVAVRRARAALSQLKGILPKECHLRLRQELSWLGGATGPTRDLDVFQLEMPTYAAQLPAAVARDLEPMAAFLRSLHRKEQRKLARLLGTTRYDELKQLWRSVVEAPMAAPKKAPNASRPVLEIASKRISKVHRQILNLGRSIHRETPAQALHDLRILCKKLRYLLEFFRSLYPAKPIAGLLAQLKGLQNNLGAFNDYEVQGEQLQRLAEQMASEGSAPTATLLATGRLLEHLEKGQAEERKRFHERFADFEKGESKAQELFLGSKKDRLEA